MSFLQRRSPTRAAPCRRGGAASVEAEARTSLDVVDQDRGEAVVDVEASRTGVASEDPFLVLVVASVALLVASCHLLPSEEATQAVETSPEVEVQCTWVALLGAAP